MVLVLVMIHGRTFHAAELIHAAYAETLGSYPDWNDARWTAALESSRRSLVARLTHECSRCLGPGVLRWLPDEESYAWEPATVTDPNPILSQQEIP